MSNNLCRSALADDVDGSSSSTDSDDRKGEATSHEIDVCDKAMSHTHVPKKRGRPKKRPAAADAGKAAKLAKTELAFVPKEGKDGMKACIVVDGDCIP